MEDSYLHKGMRKKLMEEVAAKGITDKIVLKAIENVPRHFFMGKRFHSRTPLLFKRSFSN